MSGPDADVFKGEAGGHRWQRKPKNAKRDQVHSSTITVAVLPEPTANQLELADRDLEWTTCRGSGPGGQNRNKVESAVQLKHLPTGIMVRCETERSQHQNRQTALGLLRARLQQAEQERLSGARAADRRQQVGTGERSCKIRTVAVQRGTVVDHKTGKKWQLERYLRGDW